MTSGRNRRLPRLPLQLLQCEAGHSYLAAARRVDLRRGEVWRGSDRVPLSPKEFQLIRYMIEHSDAVLSREELLLEVWGYDPCARVLSRTVDTHAYRLRRKLEQAGAEQMVQTVRGVGWRLTR